MLLLVGGCLFALLAAAFLVVGDRHPSNAPAEPVPALRALEDRLGRPVVMYVDGPVTPAFNDALADLDALVGALAAEPVVRSLLDLDVYVMLRDTWPSFDEVTDHDLGSLIRERARAQAPDTGATWFEATLQGADKTQREVLVILVARDLLAGGGDFCMALTIYDLARFSGNALAFVTADSGEGTHWRRCRKEGWRSVADLPPG
ncbi:MAG: hypothetical protein AAF727_16875 [Pseudomonadota bacterium]